MNFRMARIITWKSHRNQYLLQYWWVAKDEAALAENIKHIHFFFEIDGRDYYDERFTAQDVAYTVDNPDRVPSIFTGVITSGWKIGEPHQIRIGYEFDAEIFDGWIPTRGHPIRVHLPVTPVILPTVTATPSPMPIPTAVPYTSTPLAIVTRRSRSLMTLVRS